MKKIKISLLISFFTFHLCWGQDSTKTIQILGEPIFKVFGNYHKGITEADKSSAFEVKRAYFGYKFDLKDNFTAEVKLDIGSPDDVSENNLKRRFSYFKTAALTYSKNGLSLNLGLIGLYQFKVQESFWGYRYIYNSFQDRHKFGPSADIGISATYKINDIFSVDGAYVNGEGYSKLQSDDAYKSAVGISITPLKKLIIRAYYDFIDEKEHQQNMAFFCGFKMKSFRIGGEYNKQFNHNSIKDYDLEGYSVHTTYSLNKKYGVFARYDYLTSNIVEEGANPWNLKNDGTAIIAGVEYKISKRVKMSLNYQDWYEAAKNGEEKAMVYLNFEFKY